MEQAPCMQHKLYCTYNKYPNGFFLFVDLNSVSSRETQAIKLQPICISEFPILLWKHSICAACSPTPHSLLLYLPNHNVVQLSVHFLYPHHDIWESVAAVTQKIPSRLKAACLPKATCFYYCSLKMEEILEPFLCLPTLSWSRSRLCSNYILA